MENASKALIIAGAILIAILLISIGIIVMNSINDPIDQAGDQAQSQAIEMFNSKFTGYAGTQKASAVKALITSVNSSNGVNTSHNITMSKNGTAVNSASEIQSKLNSQNEYVVSFSYADGYITNVDVSGIFN